MYSSPPQDKSCLRVYCLTLQTRLHSTTLLRPEVTRTLAPLVRLCIEMDVERFCVSCSDTSARSDHIRMMSCSLVGESITAIPLLMQRASLLAQWT